MSFLKLAAKADKWPLSDGNKSLESYAGCGLFDTRIERDRFVYKSQMLAAENREIFFRCAKIIFHHQRP